MTPQELMISKYECIADYPCNNFKVGDIVSRIDLGDKPFYNTPNNAYCAPEWVIVGYPHLFRKMDWNEQLPIESYPKYVRAKVLTLLNGLIEGVFVADWTTSDAGVWTILQQGGIGVRVFASQTTPATLSEYTAYVNEKNK